MKAKNRSRSDYEENEDFQLVWESEGVAVFKDRYPTGGAVVLDGDTTIRDGTREEVGQLIAYAEGYCEERAE